MKLISFQTPDQVPHEKLMKYLLQRYPDVPQHAFRDAFAKRDVKVDGVRVSKDTQLSPNAIVQVYLPEEKQITIPVLFQNKDVLIVHKPAGVSCEADIHADRSLCNILAEQLNVSPLLVHRLDNPTEGILVLALNESTQETLTDAFRNHTIQKQYICLVKGLPQPAHAILSDYLLKDARHAEVHVTPSAKSGGKPIITEYELLSYDASSDTSRLLITLHTGRTHQIRAHMAYIGHPVLGDDQYGDREFNKRSRTKKLRLCSCRLHFPVDGVPESICSKTFETNPHF